jgi:hypothetical protein
VIVGDDVGAVVADGDGVGAGVAVGSGTTATGDGDGTALLPHATMTNMTVIDSAASQLRNVDPLMPAVLPPL